jgi:hypothetical protein
MNEVSKYFFHVLYDYPSQQMRYKRKREREKGEGREREIVNFYLKLLNLG